MKSSTFIIIFACSITALLSANWFTNLFKRSPQATAASASEDLKRSFLVGKTTINLLNHQNILASDFCVDAIVNAANEGCLGGGGIDGVISKAGGKKLHEARAALPEVDGIRCPTGQARLTIAGDIANASFVIHAVGPRCTTKDALPDAEKELLVSAYISSLERISNWNHKKNDKDPEFKAIKESCIITSVAFPAISAGIFNCNVTLAAPHVARAVVDWVRQNQKSKIDTINLVFYNPQDPSDATLGYNAYKKAFEDIV